MVRIEVCEVGIQGFISNDLVLGFELARGELFVSQAGGEVPSAASTRVGRRRANVVRIDHLPQQQRREATTQEHTQRKVRPEIERVLHQELPDSYDRSLFKQKCDNVFDLTRDHVQRGIRWAP